MDPSDSSIEFRHSAYKPELHQYFSANFKALVAKNIETMQELQYVQKKLEIMEEEKKLFEEEKDIIRDKEEYDEKERIGREQHEANQKQLAQAKARVALVVSKGKDFTTKDFLRLCEYSEGFGVWDTIELNYIRNYNHDVIHEKMYVGDNESLKRLILGLACTYCERISHSKANCPQRKQDEEDFKQKLHKEEKQQKEVKRQNEELKEVQLQTMARRAIINYKGLNFTYKDLKLNEETHGKWDAEELNVIWKRCNISDLDYNYIHPSNILDLIEFHACNNCSRISHRTKDCPNLMVEKIKEESKEAKESNIKEEVKDEEVKVVDTSENAKRVERIMKALNIEHGVDYSGAENLARVRLHNLREILDGETELSLLSNLAVMTNIFDNAGISLKDVNW